MADAGRRCRLIRAQPTSDDAVDEEKETRGFKVEDRRRFSADGEARPEAAATDAPAAPPQAAAEPGPKAAPPPPAPGKGVAEVSFSALVISLSTQAMVLLGEIPDPSTRAPAADLDGARQVIDILGMLQLKTRGNLDEAESGLIESALFDLRMQYVQRARQR